MKHMYISVLVALACATYANGQVSTQIASSQDFPAVSADAQAPKRFPPPLSVKAAEFFRNNPAAYTKLPRGASRTAQVSNDHVMPLTSGTWQVGVAPFPPGGSATPLLMMDGTVIVASGNSPTWYKLTPDINGSYVNGTWTQIASLPVISGTQYAPLYHASVVLPDGRVLIMGGEYNGSGTEVWTNLGAIYDPIADTWTAVSAPSGSGWSRIGDAESTILADGTFMLASCCSDPAVDALFDATNLTWTATGGPTAGLDYQDEQGYELLPNGDVLTIDVWTNYPSGGATNAEIYNPASGTWSSAGNTPVSLVDPSACGTWEIGPAVLRPDGTVVAFGGNTGCTTPAADPTAIYNSSTNTWTAGPNVPEISGSYFDLADAPAALLPDGNILFAASPGFVSSPTHFFEFSTTNTIDQVNDTVDYASSSSAYSYNFLVLPNGQIMSTDFSSLPEFYTPVGSPNSSWAPVISSAPSSVAPGSTYTISGTQFNGLSQGAYYGDDVQGATNYPLVRITNNSTGHVFYARTTNPSNSSVAPGDSVSVSFTVAGSTETGASTLVVIADGIASVPMSVTVGATATLTVNDIGQGTVTSSDGNINCANNTGTCSFSYASGTTVTLNASAMPGWGFMNWSGTGCSGSNTSCTVVMNNDLSATATFTQNSNFTLSASPTTLTVPQGSSGTSTITVADVNGFTGSVTLAASGLPTGVTSSFTPNPTTSTSTLTLTASGTATEGTKTITITGTSGSLSASTTLTLTVSSSAQTYTFSTLVSFPASSKKSAVNPYAPIIDSSGNIYGVSANGGKNGKGTAFKVTPSGTLSIIYNFGASSTDGANPLGTPVRDSSGNLYGLTIAGGAHGFGTVFKITSAGKESVLHSFSAKLSGTNASLTRDSAGNLYGYNTSGNGSLFKLTSSRTYSVVYTFCSLSNCADGAQPSGGPIMESNGNLYGVTYSGGGSANCSPNVGCGVVFEVTSKGKETVLHSFTGNGDGAQPLAKLTQDSAGNLYGTTYYGGLGYGTVFKVSASGQESVLYDFCSLNNCADGSFPVGPVSLDSADNVYGISSQGGSTNNYGTVYEVTTPGEETVLYNAAGPAGLGYGLVMDKSGNLYGTTWDGGSSNNGSVYKLTKN